MGNGEESQEDVNKAPLSINLAEISSRQSNWGWRIESNRRGEYETSTAVKMPHEKGNEEEEKCERDSNAHG